MQRPELTPGPLVDASPWALAFRTLQPEPQRPRRLLLLLHGVGGDETQLAGLGAKVGASTLVVLPRGPRSIAGERLGWFRVGLAGDEPEIVPEEAEHSRLKLIEFIGQCQQRHDIAAADTVLAGFSQGGVIGASAALTEPRSVAGFAVLAGRILPEIEPLLGDRDALASLHALIVHGRDDDTLPVGWARRAAEWLQRLRIPHELRLHDGGHALSDAMQREFIDWYDRTACQPRQPGSGGRGR